MSNIAPIQGRMEHHWLRHQLEETLQSKFPITARYVDGHRVRIELENKEADDLREYLKESTLGPDDFWLQDRYDEGFDDGKEQGYDNGVVDGREEGFSGGRAEGIEEGEKAGAAEVIQIFLDMISGGAKATQVVQAVMDSARLMGLS